MIDIKSDLAMVQACLNNARDHLTMYKKTRDEYHVNPIKIFTERAERRIEQITKEMEQ